MSITRVSEFVLDDNSVSAIKLKATPGSNGQVLAVDSLQNLYFTDRITSEEIDDRVAALINAGTHANISIIYDDVANTLSFSASGAVTSVNTQIGDVVLDTDDISEGITNLYFTTLRTRNSISASGDLSYNSSTGVLSVTTYKSSDFDTDFSTKTTTNLAEGTNLYFTTTRSRSSISVIDSGGDGSLGYNSSTGVISYAGPSAAEVRAHFSGGTGVGISDGEISIGQDVSITANVTFNDISATGNIQVDGNLTVSGTTVTVNATNLAVEDNMIYLNAGSTNTDPDLGFAGNYNDGTYAHAGFFRDATDGVWKIFDGYTPEPDASVYIDTGHASFSLADFQANTVHAEVVGNVTGTVSDISNHTTSGLTEGTNLYFTDERVDDRVSNLLVAGDNISILYNDSTNTLTINASNSGGYDLSNNSSDDLSEGTTNLYYTDERVDDRLSSLLVAGTNINLVYDDNSNTLTVSANGLTGNTTDDLTEGTTNLYFTNSRARNSMSASGDLSYNSSTGVFSVTTYKTSNFNTDFATKTTSNLTEGTNLYYTDERVDDRIANLLIAGSNITLTYNDVSGTLTIAANNSGGYDLSNNTTDDLTEGTTNLYYTDQRVTDWLAQFIIINDTSEFGGLVYNSITGVIDHNGVTTTEIRSTLSSTNGITYSSATGEIGLDSTASVQFVDLTLTGNLTVSGTTTSINTVEMQVADNIITLNSDLGSLVSPTENAGIEVNRGNQNTTAIRWNETTDKWQFTNNGITYQDIGSLASSSTDDLSEGTSNLYFTAERAQDAVAAALVGGTNIMVSYDDLSNLITIASSNTGGYDLSNNTTDDLSEGTTNLYYASSLFDTDFSSKSTDDLSEGTTNLYFTDDRADARVDILRTDLTVDGNASVHFNNLSNVPVVTKDVLVGTGAQTDFLLSASPGSPDALIVTLNGVTQTPGSDYTVSGITLTFSTALPSGQVAIVRHVGYQVVGGTTGNYLDLSGGTMSGSIFVNADNSYDLGTATNQWRAVYGHSIEATYADLAERYESDKYYDQGTVVVFGGKKEITTTSIEEDVAVAGVISTNPAYKMNSHAGDDLTHPYVALRGRVPCKVTGPVKKGDLLVTSELEGFARSVGKSDRGHAVFAKSLTENLTDGNKIIEVVII